MLNLSSTPSSPGCYIFKNHKGIIIYIGKAKNLKKRVNSYFNKTHVDEKTNILVSQIDSADFIATDTEVESLILENNLIKKHQPKYNIDLKDSKRYAYLRIAAEESPRLLLARNRIAKGEYFGPFTSAATRDYVKQYLTKAFKLRTCNRLPKKACLRFHINLCSAPCINNISKTNYDNNVQSVRQILKGHTDEVSKRIATAMSAESKKLNFERALDLRNQLDAINYLGERQKMETKRKYDEDIINFKVKNNRVYLMLFNIYKGILENKQEFEFDAESEFLEKFITQFYDDAPVPKEIILTKSLPQSIVDFLSLKRNSKVKIVVPKIGEKKQLLTLVEKNIDISFFGEEKKLEDLKTKLRLNEIPRVIECFDISHLSGTNTVASMVQFRNGKPDKSNYRKFKIRTVDGVDDFKSLAEVVYRRYSRLLKEQSAFPDLIVIDGGKGQLSSTLEVLKKLNLKIPIISLAKRLEEVFVPGLSFPIILNEKSDAIKLLQQLRDEAHRFAITFNRKLRSKSLFD